MDNKYFMNLITEVQRKYLVFCLILFWSSFFLILYIIQLFLFEGKLNGLPTAPKLCDPFPSNSSPTWQMVPELLPALEMNEICVFF